ncbi:MAG: hypothetical protein BWK76_07095 [Desulfobulbaceae bacterium A2]|nr:MAG: hypothetical protein BWK76_07095 [Desulfobulbaceae bacterium A2]
MKTVRQFFLAAKAIPSIPLYFILRQNTSITVALAAALGYAACYLFIAQRAREDSAIDWAFASFWAISLLTNLAAPGLARVVLNQYFTTGLYLCLLAAAILPPLLGREPFTAVFAKRKTNPVLWQSRQFKRINELMSLGWAAIFLICLLLSLLPDPKSRAALPILFVMFAGIPFTKKFPDWYLARAEREEREKKEAAPAPLVGPETTGRPQRDAMEKRKMAAALGPIKKALVIFGSPRGAKGHTHTLLERFLQGLRDNGVETETVLLIEKTIRPCSGCFSCWTKTPGVCIHKDDMAELLERERQADLVVFAQPLYVFSVPGITKNYLDRRLPMLMPHLVENTNGITRHPRRWPRPEPTRLLVFSVCGFPEKEHFAGLVTTFRQLAETAESPIVGEILRPASESFRFRNKLGGDCKAVFDALYQAGREVAAKGYVEPATEEAISRPLIPDHRAFHRVANTFWDAWIAYEEAKRRGETALFLDEALQENAGLFFAGMASRFNQQAGGGFTGAIQFHLTGAKPEDHFLAIDEGGCVARTGTAVAQDLTIHADWRLWLEIADGKVSGQEALLDGRYRIEGDIDLLQRMRRMFS